MQQLDSQSLPGHKQFCINVLVIWGLMVLSSLACVDIPGPGESYYLTKAKHYWQPDWLAADFFLKTPDSHLIFYATLGWVTNFVSLDASAVILRICSFGLLAFGFTFFTRQLSKYNYAPILICGIYYLIRSRVSLAGEWISGGVESSSKCWRMDWYSGGTDTS